MSLRRIHTEKTSTDENFDRDVEVEALSSHLTDLISRVMQREGVTRAELARRLGVSRPHITQTLSGERNMTLRTVAEALYELGHRLEARAVPRSRHEESTWVRFDECSRPISEFKDEFMAQLVRRRVGELADESDARWIHFHGSAHKPRQPHGRG